MTTFRVNFSEVESFEVLPAGVYSVVVIDYRTEEGAAGTYIAYTLEIEEGEYKNRKLWINLSLSPRAAWKLQEALVAFGVSKEQLQDDFEFNPEDYIGAACSAVVSQSKYQDRLTNSVSQLLPLTKKPGGPKAGPKAPTARGIR